jgi:hypothetical protein
MTDLELLDGFERGALPPGSFHHREHVRLTWLYLERGGRGDAEARLLAGLQAFAARAGKPDRFDAALTSAWVGVIDTARRETGAATFEQLIARRPDLLDRGFVRSAAAPAAADRPL